MPDESAHHPAPSAEPRLRTALVTLYLSESLGARQLASSLREAGHWCALIFFKQFQWGEFRPVTSREEELLRELLQGLRLDLVGISITSSLTADLAYHVADLVRGKLGVPVALGGAHPSVCPEESLAHADYVCRGEGEAALLELAAALAAGRPAETIANLWTHADGAVRRNDVRALTDDLDQLPFPSFGHPDSYLIEADQLERRDPATQIPMYHTYASRMACPFACTFCAGVWLRRELYAGKGPVRRYRSVGRILEEIRQARERHPGIELIQFWDEVFAVRPPEGWREEFCRRFPGEVGLPFAVWSHPSLVTEESVTALRRAGLKSVVLGVESGSERVRREVLNRKERNAAVLRAAEVLHRHGVEVGYDFILDLPWLAEENCRGTFELVMQLPRPFRVGLHSLSFLPGTAITARALAEGLIRPGQLASAHRSLAERFESFLWKQRLRAGDRASACWHSLIYLASLPFVPRGLLWRLYRWRWLLRLWPQPLVVAAEAARIKAETGQPRLWPALAAVYPELAGFFARHPTLGRATNRVVRALGRLALRLVAGRGPA